MIDDEIHKQQSTLYGMASDVSMSRCLDGKYISSALLQPLSVFGCLRQTPAPGTGTTGFRQELYIMRQETTKTRIRSRRNPQLIPCTPVSTI